MNTDVVTPKWLLESESWERSETFIIGTKAKSNPPPIVGTTIGNRTIISAWVNKYRTLKAYETICKCGNISKYIRPDTLKKNISTMCDECASTQRSKTVINKLNRKYIIIENKYGRELVNRLNNIHRRMKHRVLKSSHYINNNISLYKPWYDFQVFFNYAVLLERSADIGYTIDRINTLKSYEPGNIRFIENRLSPRNRRDAVYINFKDEEPVILMDFIENEFGLYNFKDDYNLYSFIMNIIKEDSKNTGEILIDKIHTSVHKNKLLEKSKYYRGVQNDR